MKKLVVVGSGMSAMKGVDEMLKIDQTMYQIMIIGAETVLPYNRIMLSPVLSGEKTFKVCYIIKFKKLFEVLG